MKKLLKYLWDRLYLSISIISLIEACFLYKDFESVSFFCITSGIYLIMHCLDHIRRQLDMLLDEQIRGNNNNANALSLVAEVLKNKIKGN